MKSDAISSDVYQKLVLCEGEASEIKCGQGYAIYLYGVTWTAVNASYCDDISSTSGDTCDDVSDEAYSATSHICKGKNSCSITAATSIYKDPCTEGTTKQLTVEYQCVSYTRKGETWPT